jgi:hypothetical protein
VKEVELLEGEEVQLKIRRSRLGLVLIWSLVIVALVVLTVLFIMSRQAGALGLGDAGRTSLSNVILMLYVAAVLIGWVNAIVWKGNELIVTNKRVLQKTTLALFAQSFNVIDLKMIEDVSLKREGILSYLFHFGTIRMATVGDETTYTMKYVDTPDDEMDLITQLVNEAQEEDKK